MAINIGAADRDVEAVFLHPAGVIEDAVDLAVERTEDFLDWYGVCENFELHEA